MVSSQSAAEIERVLAALGLELVGIDDLARLEPYEPVRALLTRGEQRADYLVAYAPELTISGMRASTALRERIGSAAPSSERLLLLGPRVTERSALQLRLNGIDYVDRAGNASIRFRDVYIDVRGRKALGSEFREENTQTVRRGGMNLFSPKRAQVAFAILAWPRLLQSPIRELARAAGVSLGLAQSTVESFEAYGFLRRGELLSAHQTDRLLDRWATAYPSGLGAGIRTRVLSGDIANLKWEGRGAYLSGELAVPELLRAETLTVYTSETPVEMIRSRRWHAGSGAANIFLRAQFWQPPVWVTAVPATNECVNAPWPLVYADLLAAGEGRQQEAAEAYRESAQWSIST